MGRNLTAFLQGPVDGRKLDTNALLFIPRSRHLYAGRHAIAAVKQQFVGRAGHRDTRLGCHSAPYWFLLSQLLLPCLGIFP